MKYTGTTSAETVNLIVKAEEKDADLQVSLGDQVLTSGVGSIEKEFHVQEGENQIRVKVVSPDEKETKTYEIALKASGDVYLSDLDWESQTSGDSKNPTTKIRAADRTQLHCGMGKRSRHLQKESEAMQNLKLCITLQILDIRHLKHMLE